MEPVETLCRVVEALHPGRFDEEQKRLIASRAARLIAAFERKTGEVVLLTPVMEPVIVGE